MSYGPALNAAAVLLGCYGNVPPERAAGVIAMLLGVPVSAGFVDKAAARVSAQLGRAGFEEAMLAALAAEDVLAADETPVNVLDGTAPAAAGEQEADPEEHVIRRCRAVTELGSVGVQNWAGDIIAVLHDAHAAVEAARARGGHRPGPESPR